MAKLSCPCGNSISNSHDGFETEYDFISFSLFNKYYDTTSVFSLYGKSDECINIFKCDMCDRFMVFDEKLFVARYMKRICVDDLPADLSNKPCVEGYIFNNLLFNEVDDHYTREWEISGKAFDYTWDYLTPKRIEEEIFSGREGRFRHWWYCRNYTDYIVFYSEKAMKQPLKAWMRYEQIWKDEKWASTSCGRTLRGKSI